MKTVRLYRKTDPATSSHRPEISDGLASVLDPESLGHEEILLKNIASATEKLLGRGEASVFLVTGPPNEKVITYKAGSSDITSRRLAGFQLQLGEGIVGWTVKTGESQLVADVQDLKHSKNGPTFSVAADEQSDYPTRSLACVPMIIQDQIIGAIEIVDELPDRFSEADLNLLSSIASFSAMAIQESKQILAVKHQSQLLAASVKVLSQTISSLDNLEQLLEKIADSIHLNFDFDCVGLYLVNDSGDPDDRLICLTAASGKRSKEIRALLTTGHQLEVGDHSVIGWATGHSKPCIVLHVGEQRFRIRYVDSPEFEIEQDVSKLVTNNKFLPETRAAIALPLTTYGKTIGAISIQSEDSACFSEENFHDEDVNTLKTLVDQLAFIIHHAKSYQQTKLEKKNLEIIQDIDRQIIGTTHQNLTENLRLILTKGLELIGAESGQIFRYDDRTKTLVEKVSTTEIYTKEPRPVVGVFETVVSSKKPALIADLRKREPLASMKSRLTVPLITGELVIGIFNAESPRLKAFNQRDQEIIEALAPQATIAIQNAYLFNRAIHRASLLKAASEVSSNAISIRNLDDLLNTTVETIVEKFGYYHAAIFLVDEEKREWAVLRAGSGEAGQKMLTYGYRLRVGSDTAVGQATGPFRKPRLVSYLDQERKHLKNPHLPGTLSEIALPLSVKTGKQYEILGALSVHSAEEIAFAKRDIAMLQAMADQLAVIISNDRLYSRTEAKRQLVEVLREIDRRIINPDEPKVDLLNFILKRGRQLTRAEAGQIFLVGGDNELIVEMATEKRDLNAKVPMVVGTVIGDAVFRDHILIADLKKLLAGKKEQPNKRKEESIDYSRAYKKSKRSRAAVRINEEDGSVVGVLSVEHSEPDQFTTEHLDILSALAGQAAITIKNRTLMAQAEVRNRHLEATAQVGADIISSLNVEELLNKAVDLIQKKFNLYYAGIFLIEEVEEKGRKQRLARLKAASSIDERQLSNGDLQFEVGGKSMIGSTTGTGQAKISQVALGAGKGTVRLDRPTSAETLSKMTLPLRNRKGVIGALEVQSVETVFTEDDTQTLQIMADQLAVALYNAELYQHTEEDKQQLAALRDIDRAIISTELDLDQTLKLILENGLALINAKHGSLSLLENDHAQLSIVMSSQEEEIGSILPVDKSILGLAVEKQQSIRIPNVSVEPRFQTNNDFYGGSEIASMLLVPLIENSSITGVISAYSHHLNAFSEKQQETLETLAGQAAIAIKNASLFSQAERRAALLKAGAKVSQSVISVFDLDRLLDKIVNTICDEFKEREFHYTAVFLLDETGKYASQRAGTGEVGRQMVAQGFEFKLGVDDSIVSTVIQTGQGMIEEFNIQSDENHHPAPLLPDTQSEMALPLKIGDKVIGALTVHSRQQDAFTDEDVQTLQSMADQLAIAIDNVKKQENLLEAEALKGIAEATSQSMHWVANQTAPIQYWIKKIEDAVEPIISRDDVDERVQEDFFEGIDIIKENANLILEVKTGIMGTVREFKIVNVSLEDAIEEVVKNLDFPAQHIEQNIAAELPLIRVDRIAIQEVFRNLCVNAVHAMKDTSSPKLEIMAQRDESGDFVEVKVTDSGVGIPPDKIKDIWTPFYTTKAGAGGTGVGLSYCLQAMNKMGGEISVESEVGRGTTFILEIPVGQKP